MSFLERIRQEIAMAYRTKIRVSPDKTDASHEVAQIQSVLIMSLGEKILAFKQLSAP
jgi:hypothetical protein